MFDAGNADRIGNTLKEWDYSTNIQWSEHEIRHGYDGARIYERFLYDAGDDRYSSLYEKDVTGTKPWLVHEIHLAGDKAHSRTYEYTQDEDLSAVEEWKDPLDRLNWSSRLRKFDTLGRVIDEQLDEDDGDRRPTPSSDGCRGRSTGPGRSWTRSTGTDTFTRRTRTAASRRAGTTRRRTSSMPGRSTATPTGERHRRSPITTRSTVIPPAPARSTPGTRRRRPGRKNRFCTTATTNSVSETVIDERRHGIAAVPRSDRKVGGRVQPVGPHRCGPSAIGDRSENAFRRPVEARSSWSGRSSASMATISSAHRWASIPSASTVRSATMC